MTGQLSRRNLLMLAGAGAIATACDSASVSIDVDTDASALNKRKISLAAYSLRKYLPDYRPGSSRTGNEPLDMMGFLDYCGELGVDAAEITAYYLPDPCPLELVHAIKMKAHGLGLELSGGAIGNNFTYGPGPETDKQLAYTERWIKNYSAMGVPVIRVFAGKLARPDGPPVDHNIAMENAIKSLKSAAIFAEQNGVLLGLENHDSIENADRVLAIVDAVDSAWLGVNFDSANLEATPDPYAELAKLAPRTVNAQIKVSIPVNGVEQRADFARLMKILDDAHFKGYAVLEYEEEQDPYEAIPQLIEELRSLVG